MPLKLGPTYVQALLQTFFVLLLESADMSVHAEEKNMIEDSFGRGGGEEEEEVCGRTDVKFVEVCLHHPDMCTEKFTIYKL